MMAVSGFLASRFGSLKGLVAGIVAYAAMLTFIPLANNFATLFAVLVFFGAAANLVNITLNTQAVDVEKLYDRNIMASFHGIWSLGGLCGGLVGMGFVRITPDIEPHFIAIAIFASIGILLCSRHLVADIEPEATAAEPSLFCRIDKAIIFLGLIAFAGMFCEGTLFDWSSVYFATVVRPSDGLIRLGYVCGMGMMTLGRFVADGFINRHGPVNTLRVCGCLIIAGLLTATILPDLVFATIGFMLVGMGISSIVPICYSQAGRHKVIAASTAITLVSSISFIGFMIGPPLIGMVAQWTNLRLSLGLASVFGLLVVILARFVNLSSRH